MAKSAGFKPLTWVLIIGWLVVVVAVYTYVYSSGLFNNTVSAANEMTSFYSSLMQEENIRAAEVTIENFSPFDEAMQATRALVVAVDAPGICTVEEVDSACLAFRKRIAAKALNEYPNIDSFSHLNIVVQHHRKILLIINFNTAFSDRRTIDEWREEIRDLKP